MGKRHTSGTQTGDRTAVTAASTGTPQCTPRLSSLTLSRRCIHDSCIRWRQTHCHGYCITHATLYNDPSVSAHIAHRAPVDAQIKTEVTLVDPQIKTGVALAPLSRRCDHDSCTRWKRSGCHGYCQTHAKLYDDPPSHGCLARKAPVDAPTKTGVICRRMDAEQAAVSQAATTKTIPSANTTACHDVTPAKKATSPTATTSVVNNTLTALVSAAEKDPTLWNTPTFSEAMSAVIAQLAAKPPA